MPKTKKRAQRPEDVAQKLYNEAFERAVYKLVEKNLEATAKAVEHHMRIAQEATRECKEAKDHLMIRMAQGVIYGALKSGCPTLTDASKIAVIYTGKGIADIAAQLDDYTHKILVELAAKPASQR